MTAVDFSRKMQRTEAAITGSLIILKNHSSTHQPVIVYIANSLTH